MIKIQQEGCPVAFRTRDDGTLIFATNTTKSQEFYGHIELSAWTPEQLRYVADTLEEARANNGKLVMWIKSDACHKS